MKYAVALTLGGPTTVVCAEYADGSTGGVVRLPTQSLHVSLVDHVNNQSIQVFSAKVEKFPLFACASPYVEPSM